MIYIIDELKPKNQIQQYFQNTFLELIELFNNEEKDKFDFTVTQFSFKLLSLLLENKPHLNIHDQQSCSEFFLLLIEDLGVEHFFKTKHEIEIECSNCGNKNTKMDESHHFEMFCDSMLEQQKEIRVSIEEFISSSYTVDDYRCDKCNQRGNAKVSSKASTISEYFVILLNKYFVKNLVLFPSKFILPVREHPDQAESEFLVWKTIAQVEHNGNLLSGHYTALCKRMERVFLFNDMKTQLWPFDKLNPTKYTYMVFYEKQ